MGLLTNNEVAYNHLQTTNAYTKRKIITVTPLGNSYFKFFDLSSAQVSQHDRKRRRLDLVVRDTVERAKEKKEEERALGEESGKERIETTL